MPTYLCHGFRWHRQSILRQIVKNDLEDAALHWIIAPRSQAQIIQSFHDMLGFLEQEGDEVEPHPEPAGAPSQTFTAIDKKSKFSTRGEQPNTAVAPAELSSAPEIFLLEEYNPDDLVTFAAPWAYVADYVKRVDTSVSVFEEISNHERNMATQGLVGLTMSDASTKTSDSGSAHWLEELRSKIEVDEKIDWYVVVCGDEKRANSDCEEGTDTEGDIDDEGECENE